MPLRLHPGFFVQDPTFLTQVHSISGNGTSCLHSERTRCIGSRKWNNMFALKGNKFHSVSGKGTSCLCSERTSSIRSLDMEHQVCAQREQIPFDLWTWNIRFVLRENKFHSISGHGTSGLCSERTKCMRPLEVEHHVYAQKEPVSLLS